ncbi:MAG: hypothetical protein DMG58_11090 [Acidobacteria bacterium]|nr:MAG: hypothetical protein DMG58_11090 [Acidobacteriota bacterium]
MVCPEKVRLQYLFAVAIDRDAKTMKSLHNTTGAAFSKALKEASMLRVIMSRRPSFCSRPDR